VRTAIVRHPIDSDVLVQEVAAHRHGATVLFLGTVRDMNEGDAVRSLDYTAYGAMAERELECIVAETTARWPEANVVVEHRIGTLELGDVSVAIAAAHPHRGEAFDAARYVIEELKKRLPIWKREHYVDGRAEWVANSGSETILSDAKEPT
jgi:molybdopterin synthase catalytic subunit